MDPVTAIGFAASILNFIDFSWNLVQGTYEVYKSASGTTAENAHISTILEDLKEVTEGLHSDISSSKQARQLSKLAKQCLDLSRDLTKILEKLRVRERNSTWQAVKVTWASMRKEKTVVSIEKRLGEYRAEIVFRLNLVLFSQQSSVKAQLDKIHAECLHLSSESANHMTEVHKDLSQKIKQLQDMRNPSESSEGSFGINDSQVLTEIRISLSKLIAIANTISRENLCLKRLYFESMHQREDSVEDPGGGSFGWMLEEQTKEDGDRPNTKMILERAESIRFISTAGSSDLIDNEGDTISESHDESEGSDEYDSQESIRSAGKENDWDGASEVRDDSESDTRSASSLEDTASAHLDAEEVERRHQTSDAFISFLRKDHGVFFISGKAGSGKSTILKFLAHHQRVREELASWADSKKLVFVSTFFWNSGDRMQMSLEGFYRSILFETLKQCPDLLQELFPIFDDHAALGPPDRDTPFRISELRAAFRNLTRAKCSRNYRFCFFIDGLDEYEGDSIDHIALAKSLEEMAKCEDVKVVCSARPYAEFLDTFKSGGRTVYLHDLTRDDIRRFARAQFMSILKDSGYDENREEYLRFTNNIVIMADGVFLWARLVVRSLLSGIIHSDSPRDLQERLENTPKDLNALFRKMLDGVDDAVRKRSDKMLLVATHNPFNTPLNALAYSWLNNLGDPNFPFNQPFEGYSDEEVTRRIQIVRHQVDILTKGLLEIRTKVVQSDEWYPDFPYFRYRVEFFHRNVRDYLKNEWAHDEIALREGDIDKFDTYCRLRLAEAKFSGNCARYDEKGEFYFCIFSMINSSIRLFTKNNNYFSPNYFEEWGGIVENYQHLLDSHPRPDKSGSCHRLWQGTVGTDSIRRGCTIKSYERTGYLHWVSSLGFANVLELFEQHTDFRNIDTGELNILLTASSCVEPNLVEFLLSRGSSPRELVKIELITDSDLEDASESIEVPLWMAFLRFLAADYLDFRMGPNSKLLLRYAFILEQFLRTGIDRNIFFLGYLETPERRSRERRGHNCNPTDEELFYVELDRFLELFETENFDTLRKLLMGSVSHQVWNKTTNLLAGLAPWASSSHPLMMKYKHANLDELQKNDWRVYGVVSKNYQLLGAFQCKIF